MVLYVLCGNSSNWPCARFIVPVKSDTVSALAFYQGFANVPPKGFSKFCNFFLYLQSERPLHSKELVFPLLMESGKWGDQSRYVLCIKSNYVAEKAAPYVSDTFCYL